MPDRVETGSASRTDDQIANSPNLGQIDSEFGLGGFSEINKTIVEYLQFARMFNEKFPRFDTDIHGLVEESNGKRKYYVDYVRGI